MKINKVTMTGADDSVRVIDLFDISKKYPFVEWGILASRRSQGQNRFPSPSWVNELSLLYGSEINLSCHLCGVYVNEILMGSDRFSKEYLVDLWRFFKRVQINTHGIKHQWDKLGLLAIIKNNPDKEFIFQYDNANKDIIDYVTAQAENVSTLFDMSHGAGVVPKEWPLPIPGVKCGYAGGLSPINVLDQIKLIESKVGDAETWIDMETHVRSNNDMLFNLDKVRVVLEICKQFKKNDN